jgi:hypothetical protein
MSAKGWGKEGDMTQTLYAHMNKEKKKKKNKININHIKKRKHKIFKKKAHQ